MNRFLLLLLTLLITALVNGQVLITQTFTENLIDPVGLDNAPRFTWIISSPEKNITQSAYELKVFSGKKLLWTSGKKNSAQSVLVGYGGPALQPDSKYSWQVKVWDNRGRPSAWSAPAGWQMGMMTAANWKASWIESTALEDTLLYSPHLFRKQFATSRKVASATAYITSHGLFEAEINGKRIGDAYLTPGWTSYNKRLQYMAFDVTGHLRPGNNAVGITVGSGWYRTVMVWENNKNHYGDKTALLFQLNIRYTDGSSEVVVSDDSWKAVNDGPVRQSELYNGETYDANLMKKDWSMPGYNDQNWQPVRVAPLPKEHILATYNEPVKKHETFRPVKLITTPKGEKVIDFGQNLVGWVQMRMAGKKGDSIRMFHAEVLDREGNFYTTNLRSARQLNTYVLDGTERLYEPHFTFQGFRYIKVEGINGEIDTANFKAVALYSAMRETGSFKTSHKLINQLQHNIQWGQKGNFIDVPTDCPQRDERLGWTGDAQVFARTAAFNMGVHNFFAKWLQDVAADQSADGSVPFVVPDLLKAGGSAGWADAAVIIPWEMYQVYGDTSILRWQYASMQKWSIL